MEALPRVFEATTRATSVGAVLEGGWTLICEDGGSLNASGSSGGGIQDKGGTVLPTCGVVPFRSPTGDFDAQDRIIGTLSGILFRGDILTAGGAGFSSSNDSRGGSLNARSHSDRSDPGNGGGSSVASGGPVRGAGGLSRGGPGCGVGNPGILVRGCLTRMGGCNDFSSGVHVGTALGSSGDILGIGINSSSSGCLGSPSGVQFNDVNLTRSVQRTRNSGLGKDNNVLGDIQSGAWRQLGHIGHRRPQCG
jgi:hypothetical protein